MFSVVCFPLSLVAFSVSCPDVFSRVRVAVTTFANISVKPTTVQRPV